MEKLVSTQWLSQHLSDPDLVVLDCSVRTEVDQNGQPYNLSGRSGFDEGHIPTAGFADLKGDLTDQASTVEFAPPSPEAFCVAMGALGVGDDSKVVLYDNFLSAWAARVWWMLKWVGFDNAAILNGGLRAWQEEGRSLSTEAPQHPVRTLTPRPRPGLIAGQDEVRRAVEDGATCLIDTLPTPHYKGERSMYGRPGHIPSATNVSGVDLIDETGRYKPIDQLRAMHEGYDPKTRNITYCGGGILASSNAFVMSLLGFEDVAVYTASLQEWAADPDNPMTTE
jgi:thiosulfate/3-mercaptopyruvate sulfurtransferase